MRILSGRLKEIYDVIPYGLDVVADIGADHGKLIVAILLKNKAQRGFALDISEKSLDKAKILAEERNLLDRLSFFVGDGFLPISEEKVDYAIIAGMGGHETISILKQKNCVDTYVLSPHQDSHVVRKFLRDNGYFIISDFIIFDKKYYRIIITKKGINTYTDDELYLGKNSPSRQEFFDKNVSRLEYLSNLLKDADRNLKSKPLSDEIIKEYEVLIKWHYSVK